LGSSTHLSGLFFCLLDTLRHLRYRLLEFRVFRGDATQVPDALNQQMAHLFPFHWSQKQTYPQSNKSAVRETAHIEPPFKMLLVNTNTWLTRIMVGKGNR
jgi:hypothetical protein